MFIQTVGIDSMLRYGQLHPARNIWHPWPWIEVQHRGQIGMLMLVASYNVTSIAYIASDLHPGETAWQHAANCSLRQLALDSPNGPDSS